MTLPAIHIDKPIHGPQRSMLRKRKYRMRATVRRPGERQERARIRSVREEIDAPFLAVQLQEIRDWRPEQWLMNAVMEDAISNLGDYKHPARDREARVWITTVNTRYVFSFDNVCLALGLDVSATRAALLAEGEEEAA